VQPKPQIANEIREVRITAACEDGVMRTVLISTRWDGTGWVPIYDKRWRVPARLEGLVTIDGPEHAPVYKFRALQEVADATATADHQPSVKGVVEEDQSPKQPVAGLVTFAPAASPRKASALSYVLGLLLLAALAAGGYFLWLEHMREECRREMSFERSYGRISTFSGYYRLESPCRHFR
jgi:hypothetical protein